MTTHKHPEVMVTSSLTRRSARRVISTEWYMAIRIGPDKYRIARGIRAGTTLQNRQHNLVNLTTSYNQALLLLDRFEHGADPKLKTFAGLINSLDFRDNPKGGGLSGSAKKNGYRLESSDAFENGTHYSLFSPDIAPAPQIPQRLNKIGTLRKIFARAAMRMGRTPPPANVIRTRKILETTTRSRAGHYTYYVAKQDILSGLWTITRVSDGGNAAHPFSAIARQNNISERRMWIRMHAYEKAIARRAHTNPALQVEDNPYKTGADHARGPVYFGCYLPSFAHELLAMKDLHEADIRRTTIATQSTRQPPTMRGPA